MEGEASTSLQGLLSLTEPNLRSHTSSHPPQPRRTIHRYLASIQQVRGEFEYEPSPPIVDGTTPSPFQFLPHPSTVEPERKRQRIDDDYKIGEEKDTALVLHHSDRPATGGVRGLLTKVEEPKSNLKKRPSLVSAMRPRLASIPNPPLKNVKRGNEGEGGNYEGETAKRATSGGKENLRVRKAEVGTKATKGKARQAETDKREAGQQEKVLTAKGKGKGKLREEPENEREAAELEDRLENRKERRRHKALIRKDTTRSAAATGAAAASKITKSTTTRKRSQRAMSEDEGEVETTQNEVPVKKGRRSAEQAGREKVQELERPKAIGAGRLTVRPTARIGLFNKGKASARTPVGRHVPDLAFSELNFLKSTRPPAPSSSSSSAEEPAPRRSPRKKSPEQKLQTSKRSVSTQYGTKRRRRAQLEEAPDDSCSASESNKSLPPPPLPPTANLPTNETRPPKQPRLVFSHVEVPPRSSSSSTGRSSHHGPRQLHNPSVTHGPPLSQDLEPRHNVQASESGFSAHSAHSLAMRRLRKTTTQPSPLVNETPPLVQPEHENVGSTLPSPPTIVSSENSNQEPCPPATASGLASATHEGGRTEEPLSIKTASIDRLIEEANCTESPVASLLDIPTSCPHFLDPPFDASFLVVDDSAVRRQEPDALPLPSSRTLRSRSSSVAPSFRYGDYSNHSSIISRSRSQSESDIMPFFRPPSRIPSPTYLDSNAGPFQHRTIEGLELDWNVSRNTGHWTEVADFGEERGQRFGEGETFKSSGYGSEAVWDYDGHSSMRDVEFRDAMRKQWPKTTL